MRSPVLRVIALLMALVIALGVGTAVGGGIVYVATRMTSRVPQVAAASEIDAEAGIVIVRVEPDGPAAEAGAVRGDILLAIDGQRVDDGRDVWGALEEREPGDEVELTVLHGDEERSLVATLGDRNSRPFLGLMSCGGSLDVPSLERRILGLGALIMEVMSDSPAEQAGLRRGDHVMAVDGQEVGVENDLADLITAHKPGDTVTLEIKGPGEESREVAVELGEHPDEEGRAYLGVQYLPFPHMDLPEGQELPFRVPPLDFEFDRERFWIRPGRGIRQGAIVREIVEDSPAEAAGLREGDVITAINGEPVEDPGALADAIAGHQPGDTIVLTVARSDETEEREVEVTLAESPEEEGSAYLGVAIGGFLRMRWLEEGELPPEMELPDKSFEFRLPFMRDHLELDLDDALRHFEFRFPPRDLDIEGPEPPIDSG